MIGLVVLAAATIAYEGSFMLRYQRAAHDLELETAALAKRVAETARADEEVRRDTEVRFDDIAAEAEAAFATGNDLVGQQKTYLLAKVRPNDPKVVTLQVKSDEAEKRQAEVERQRQAQADARDQRAGILAMRKLRAAPCVQDCQAQCVKPLYQQCVSVGDEESTLCVTLKQKTRMCTEACPAMCGSPE